MGGDTQLKKRVEDELRWQPSVDEAAIGVSVHDAIVTLTGHVWSGFLRGRHLESLRTARGGELTTILR